jgi:hypothetical protein
MESLVAMKLSEMMLRTQGKPPFKITLIDGQIVDNHPVLTQAKIEQRPSISGNLYTHAESIACIHGTLIAGMLVGS